MNSFVNFWWQASERLEGDFPGSGKQGRKGLVGASGGKQVCLLGYSKKPGQASRKLVKRGVGLLLANWQGE